MFRCLDVLPLSFVFSKFPWDFETQTNGVVLENVLQVRHADPVVEEYRAAMVENLRNKYRSMCIEREGMCSCLIYENYTSVKINILT
jgi:hypothetical protein